MDDEVGAAGGVVAGAAGAAGAVAVGDWSERRAEAAAGFVGQGAGACSSAGAVPTGQADAADGAEADAGERHRNDLDAATSHSHNAD